MKKTIVYILMFIFLLFTAENKQTLDFQQDFGTQNVSLHLFSFAKKHHLNHSLEKASLQQSSDSLDYPEETDLNFSHAYSGFAIAIIAGLAYIMYSFFKNCRPLRELDFIFLHMKRFILLRSIRI